MQLLEAERIFNCLLFLQLISSVFTPVFNQLVMPSFICLYIHFQLAQFNVTICGPVQSNKSLDYIPVQTGQHIPQSVVDMGQ